MSGGSGLNIFISSGETDGNVIYGGAGQNYVYGSNGGDTVIGGNSVDVFLMGSSADNIVGGGGVDYAWGGGGSDTFTINDSTPEVMVIQDFNTGGVNDLLNFAGTSLHSFADVQAAETYIAGINTTIITDVAGNAAWLIGIAPGQLDASMFKFS
ncbi:calcium-binding protein [Bradyrhizobium sp. 13971]